MSSSSVVNFSVRRLGCLEVVEEPGNSLRVRPGDVMYFDEVVVRETETACEADHELFRDTLYMMHEFETRSFEAGEVLVVYPSA